MILLELEGASATECVCCSAEILGSIPSSTMNSSQVLELEFQGFIHPLWPVATYVCMVHIETSRHTHMHIQIKISENALAP